MTVSVCFDDRARPPLPPVGGAVSDEGDIHLRAGDGNRFMAYAARAAEPSGAGIVILPDVRGLHGFYKELTQLFAQAGVDAVALDYFGRSAGDGPRDEGFEFMPHVQQVTMPTLQQDVAAAIDFLRSPEGGGVRSVCTVGFCFGGSASWNQSALQPGLAGAIGLYGVPERSRAYIGQMQARLLVIVAGQDHTPAEEFQRFDAELEAASVPHRLVRYPNATHSFFDRRQAEFATESADAWIQILDFVKETSQPT